VRAWDIGGHPSRPAKPVQYQSENGDSLIWTAISAGPATVDCSALIEKPQPSFLNSEWLLHCGGSAGAEQPQSIISQSDQPDTWL
jgi:hypothetical protein